MRRMGVLSSMCCIRSNNYTWVTVHTRTTVITAAVSTKVLSFHGLDAMINNCNAACRNCHLYIQTWLLAMLLQCTRYFEVVSTGTENFHQNHNVMWNVRVNPGTLQWAVMIDQKDSSRQAYMVLLTMFKSSFKPQKNVLYWYFRIFRSSFLNYSSCWQLW